MIGAGAAVVLFLLAIYGARRAAKKNLKKRPDHRVL